MSTAKTSATKSDVDNKQCNVTVPEENLSKGKSGLACKMPQCCTSVTNKIIGAFESYGVLVGNYPLPFIIIPIVVFGGLGFGLFTLSFETDLESLYFPSNSRAINDRQKVRDLFPNVNHINYDTFAQSDAVDEAVLMFQSKNGSNIFENDSVEEIREIVAKVKNISVNKNGQSVSYSDLCAKVASQCVIEGERLLYPGFQALLSAGLISFPFWLPPNSKETVDLSFYLSKTTTNPQNATVILQAARIFKLSFKLRETSKEWMTEFLSAIQKTSSNFSNIFYGTTDSLSEELDKGTKGDIYLFALTFTLCITFASVVSSGGNPVSTRAMLANAGVLAAGLSIVGSLGLVSLCGVKFVSLVGIMPFLIIGIGVDDMFLLMSCWSEAISEKIYSDKKTAAPKHLGATFASAGIGITVTSLTDFVTFIIGTASTFRSVTNFSIYTGVAVLFCYICQASFFGGCLSLHTRRVFSKRHFLTCMKTKSREELKQNKRSTCVAVMCGGSIPQSSRDDESICEKLPRLTIPKLVINSVGRVVIIIGFLGYLAVSIYGVINLPQGLVLYNLVPKSSYYHSFLLLNDEHFPSRLPVAFVVDGKVDYSGDDGDQLQSLISLAQDYSLMVPNFQRCWLTDYVTSANYTNTSFINNLRDVFLPANPLYYKDIVLDPTNTSIIASRCYVMSQSIRSQYQLADVMTKMRSLADDSPLPVFAYQQSFVALEQYLAVLPATLQMVGVAIAVIFVVCVVFLLHPFMVVLVTITVAMILVGIFGFMYYWDTPLSSITMIHLVMSVGFSVDFSAHVCSAYLVSDASTRTLRAHDAISHAASAIFNGGVSSLLGVILLVFSDSYIFISFFRIMVLVIGFGMLHAVLFLPAVLSLIGPQNNKIAASASMNVSIGPEKSDDNFVNPCENTPSEQERSDNNDETPSSNSPTVQEESDNNGETPSSNSPTVQEESDNNGKTPSSNSPTVQEESDNMDETPSSNSPTGEEQSNDKGVASCNNAPTGQEKGNDFNMTPCENAPTGQQQSNDKGVTPCENAPTGQKQNVNNDVTPTKNAATGQKQSDDKNVTLTKNATTGQDRSDDKNGTPCKNAPTEQEKGDDCNLTPCKNAATGQKQTDNNDVTPTKNAATGQQQSNDKGVTPCKNAPTGQEKGDYCNVTPCKNAPTGQEKVNDFNMTPCKNAPVGQEPSDDNDASSCENAAGESDQDEETSKL